MNKDEVEELYINLRSQMNANWKRVLPIGELVVDRWEKAKFLGFGERSSIYDSGIVMGDVTVGKDTWIGPYTLLDGTGGQLKIGNHCDISAGVQIYTHDSIKRCLSDSSCDLEYGNVIIENNCYIAPLSIIAKGVTIGAHSVVAAHSLVKNNFDKYSIIAGIPARQIGKVVITDNNVQLEYFN